MEAITQLQCVNTPIDSQSGEKWLTKLVTYLLSNWENEFPNQLKPSDKLKDETGY
ncbi:MAG: hypothetical protein ACP5JK_02900 [Candidatus Aenigmatarchaeota archaeon]